MTDRICNAIARIVVAPLWALDRVICRFANQSHLPMDGER